MLFRSTYEGQFKELLRNRSPGEFELNRPADGWPERVFRVSLYYVSASCILGLFISKEDIEKRGGAIASVAGFLFLGCAFYALNYAVWRYVKSKFVKVAWWSFIGVLLVLFLGSMVFKL